MSAETWASWLLRVSNAVLAEATKRLRTSADIVANEGDAELYGVLRVDAQVMLRYHAVREHREQRATKHEREDDQADGYGTHGRLLLPSE